MTDYTLAYAGTSIRLGQELGRGGEGIVHAIAGKSDLVAKIYLKPDATKTAKLVSMVESRDADLLKIAAWPVDILKDRQDRVLGFVMPRIAARRDIHELYSPKSRADVFPEADFRFIVRVAANIARVFGVMHGHGHILGDVNHGNLLVGADGTVMLIDCDSFQIRHGGQLFTCDVGVPLFTAPELQGQSLRGVKRTVNHDLFGLAVLLFHLLFMGRHPFAGRYLGAGDMPIERAIKEYRFAYGPDRAANNMERPPGTIPLDTMGNEVASLFTLAFGRNGTLVGRPEARRWINALDRLEKNLRACSQAGGHHHYPGHLAACPWCLIEGQTGARLFGERIVAGPTGTVDVASLWNAITAVPSPGSSPPLPSEKAWQAPLGSAMPKTAFRTFRKWVCSLLIFAGLVSCTMLGKGGNLPIAAAFLFVAFAGWPRISADKRDGINSRHKAAKGNWESLLSQWNKEATVESFTAKLSELKRAKRELEDLPSERQRRMAKLQTGLKARQLQHYLDRFRINRAKISGIGQGRTIMLASYAIETAADIDKTKILAIPGFGESLVGSLLTWRQEHERNFRFNPNEPVDPRDVAAMERDLTKRRKDLIATLQQGPATLHQMNKEIVAARNRLFPLLNQAWNELKVAEAHWKTV